MSVLVKIPAWVHSPTSQVAPLASLFILITSVLNPPFLIWINILIPSAWLKFNGLLAISGTYQILPLVRPSNNMCIPYWRSPVSLIFLSWPLYISAILLGTKWCYWIKVTSVTLQYPELSKESPYLTDIREWMLRLIHQFSKNVGAHSLAPNANKIYLALSNNDIRTRCSMFYH